LARQRTAPGAPVGFTVGRAAEFDLGRTFDAVVCLLHVASYHTTEDEFRRMLANFRRHLPVGGTLVFDFWHGPGVLADPPVRRERRLEDEAIRVHRISTPRHDPAAHLVEVRYDVTIAPVGGGAPQHVEEIHRLRYFSVPELQPWLTAAGFRVRDTRAGLTDDTLDDRAWYGLIVATAV
jgi:hypothetical protein